MQYVTLRQLLFLVLAELNCVEYALTVLTNPDLLDVFRNNRQQRSWRAVAVTDYPCVSITVQVER